MKVIILSDTTVWGGLESHAVAFAETLIASGHQPVIVCVGREAHELYKLMAPVGITLLEVTAPPRSTAAGWLRVLRDVDADAAVLEKGTLWTGGIGLDIALRLKYRNYLTVQQLEPPDLPPRSSKRHLGGLLPGIGLWWYRWKWSGYLRSLLPRYTVGVSEAVRQRLITDYAFAPGKVVTVPNGVDPLQYCPDSDVYREIRRVWGVPVDALIFGSVCRMTPQKALDVAISAFARLVSEDPGRPMFLVLVGDGVDRPALEAQARALRVADRVRFPGFSANARTAYQGMDVFLIPSRFEGLPFSLVEAMASGCRVIGSTVGGIPEVVTSAQVGTLVPPDDVPQLTAAMKAAAHQDAAVRIRESAAARQRVIEGYDIRVQCGKIIALLGATSRMEPQACTTAGEGHVHSLQTREEL